MKEYGGGGVLLQETANISMSEGVFVALGKNCYEKPNMLE